MTYADFKKILVPVDNGNHNPKKSYTKKYQKHAASSYCYKFL